MYHVPVLLKESVDALNIRPNGVYVDLTFGGGGHSVEILSRMQGGKLFVFDQDEDARVNAEKINDDRLVFIEANFRYCRKFLKLYGVKEVDGVLADLGVSSHQFDQGERGFTFRVNSQLDMRMGKQEPLTAAKVINEYEEAELSRIFWTYGELKQARKIAATLMQHRGQGIHDSEQLKTVLASFAPRNKEHKFYAQVFQALRIEVNDELKALEEMLMQMPDVIKEGGRLSVISYHSLEDRLVKNFMRSGSFQEEIEKDFFGNPIRPFEPLKGKAIKPSDQEIVQNNRARSARLRSAERVSKNKN